MKANLLKKLVDKIDDVVVVLDGKRIVYKNHELPDDILSALTPDVQADAVIPNGSKMLEVSSVSKEDDYTMVLGRLVEDLTPQLAEIRQMRQEFSARLDKYLAKA